MPGTNDETNGLVTLTLTTDDSPGSCIAGTDDVDITINLQVTVDAGPDQAVCLGQPITLNGSSSGPVSRSTNGTGTFDDLNNPIAVYTPSAGDITLGNITFTLSGNDPCSGSLVSDQAEATISQPIQAIAVAVSASIDQAEVINVQQSANTNAGDTLTTTLLSQPTKGMVSLLADGSVEYTPNQGTVGADSIDFRICNQCNICDDNTIQVNIQNEAPEIDPPTDITTDVGDDVEVGLLVTLFDPNNNLDLSTLEILDQPISGALAFIDNDGILIVEYSGTSFTGIDQLQYRICDFSSECTTAILEILVEPKTINPFNAVSPNGDGRHDFFEIENIQFFPDNRVVIFNRWGNKIFETDGYDNRNNIFAGAANVGVSDEVPEGTYFYRIDLNDGSDPYSGFLVINR